MSLDILLKEFKENNWHDCVLFYREYNVRYSDEIKSCLDHLNIPDDIKIALIYKFEKYASEWIYKKVPALEETKPIDLLQTENGIKILKAAIMRIPS